MKVKTVFHGILSEWIGIKEAFWDLPQGSTLEDLISEIQRILHTRGPRQLWDPQEKGFAPQVVATKDGVVLTQKDAPLSDNEEIQFLLFLSGG